MSHSDSFCPSISLHVVFVIVFVIVVRRTSAKNSACSAFDRLQQKSSFSSSFSLETLFPSAKINPVKSVRNRIISMGKCLLFA